MDFREIKSRGKKHIRNKKRFNTKAVVESDHVVEEILPGNSARYNLSDSDNEEINISTDFTALAKAPISLGGHFQFKSDKKLILESEQDLSNDLCKLDLSLLNNSVGCVPFYLRCPLDEEYLTEQLKAQMNLKADWSNKEYEKFLRTLKENSVKQVENSVKSVEKSFSSVKEDSNQNKCDSKKGKASGTEKEELEHWLDDILGL